MDLLQPPDFSIGVPSVSSAQQLINQLNNQYPVVSSNQSTAPHANDLIGAFTEDWQNLLTGTPQGTGLMPDVPLASGSPTVSSATSSLGSNCAFCQSVQNFFGFITSGSGWTRIGVIVIGVVLLAIAGFMLATRGFEGTVKTITK